MSDAAGALIAFFQRYLADRDYRHRAGGALPSLSTPTRNAWLRVLLPFVRRMDYPPLIHPLLSDLVGGLRWAESAGVQSQPELLSAHK